MNILGDVLIKGVLGGLGGAAVNGLMLIVKSVATPEFMAELMADIADWFAKTTKSPVDDAGVAKVKEAMKKVGIGK